MASADQYAAWIVKNADKKGTPEFDTVAKAYKAAKTGIQVAPTTPDAATAPAEAPLSVEQKMLADYQAGLASDKQTRRNLIGGLVRGAGSIGSTLVQPGDWAADKFLGEGKQSRNEARRAAIDAGLTTLVGSDPNAGAYKAGRLTGEVTGTMGVGGALGAGLRAVAPGANALATAIETGGFRAGTTGGVNNALTRVLGGAIMGGASAGLIDPKNAPTGAMIGGALPALTSASGAVGEKAGAAIRGGTVSPEVKALAARAKQLGIDVPADRLVNSRPMNAAASALNYIPFSGRAATEDKLVKQLERAASRTIGQDSDNLSHAISAAKKDLGDKFDDVLTKNSVPLDKPLKDSLVSVRDSANRMLGKDQFRVITKQINEILAKGSSGSIDGRAAYNIKRELDLIAKGNTTEAYHAEELKDALMAALNRNLGPQESAAFSTVRKQYGNMKELEKVALRNSEEGGLSVAKLSNLELRNPDLKEIATIARQFVKVREAPHGAMQRAVAATVGGTSGVGTMMGATGLLPVTAGIAATSATGRGLNSLLASDAARNYVLRDPATQNKLLEQLYPYAARTAPVMGSR